jgi:molybdenum cofactor cytidylyltransferase
VSRAPQVAGIVLAAGASSRMGRTKQLLPFRGQTILECVVDNALASRLHRVIVVLGHEAEVLEPLLKNREVTVVRNPHYHRGQSTSLKAGLRMLREESEAALFLLGDQPLITPEIIDGIIAAYETSRSPIVLPVFEGRRGNPVLFARETFARMAELGEDSGARPLFAEYAERILKVPVDDPAIHLDIDTEEDYRRLLKEHQPHAD